MAWSSTTASRSGLRPGAGPRTTLRGSILDDGFHLGAGFSCHEESTPNGLVGCVVGHDATIGPDGRAESGVLVDPETKVPAGTRLTAPDRADS